MRPSKPVPYGYCPTCFMANTVMERSILGHTHCSNGHKFRHGKRLDYDQMIQARKARWAKLDALFPKTTDPDGNRYVNPVLYEREWYTYRSGGFGWCWHSTKEDAEKAMFAWGDWLAAMDAN